MSYTVESARVEQRTDLDKLVMEIETTAPCPRKTRCAPRRRSSSNSLRCSRNWKAANSRSSKRAGGPRWCGLPDPILLRPVDEPELTV